MTTHRPRIVDLSETQPNRRRGGDLRAMLTPDRGGRHQRLHGPGHRAARRAHRRALPPVLRGVRVRRERRFWRWTWTARPHAAAARPGSADPAERAPPLPQRRRRGGPHGLPPRPARPAPGARPRRHRGTPRRRRQRPGRAARTSRRPLHDAGAWRSPGSASSPRAESARRPSGTCSPTAVPRPAASPSSTRPGSAPGSPPSATSTRRRTASTRSRSPARTGTSSSRWSPPGKPSRDAGLDPETEDPWRIGVSLGTAVGGTTRLEHDYVAVSGSGARWDVDHRPAGPHLHRAFSPSSLASAVAEQVGAHGPVQTVSTGCTSGLDAIGYAFHSIEEGRVDVCIAGASDSPIIPDHGGLLRRDQGDLAEQRRPGARLPAVRRRPGRLRHGRGRRRARPGGAGARPRPRRDRLLRDRAATPPSATPTT